MKRDENYFYSSFIKNIIPSIHSPTYQMSLFDVVIINEITKCDDDDDIGHEDDDNDDHKLSKDDDGHVVFCTVALLLVFLGIVFLQD